MKYFLIILFIINQSQINSQEHCAVVIEPVADLLGQSMKKIHNLDYYYKIPLSAINYLDGISCPRIHQLLFNEIVKVLKETLKEAMVEVPNIFYQKNGSCIKKNVFWTLKSNLISLNKLRKSKIDTTKFPEPIDFKNNTSSNQKIVTLIKPFYDKTTKKKYSAGTRFVYKNETEAKYIVYIFDNQKQKFFNIEISKKRAVLNTEKSEQDKISNFINLLEKWANPNKGFIPYVWGGSSFCDTCDDKSFKIIDKKIKGKTISFFELPSYNTNKIKSGFDCSGLILRAAQISQIPFYFKNTITITQNLSTLKKDDQVENGDLIWIPGHIIAIVDIQNNFCVEARDYSNGYGRVQKIELNKMFKNIENFRDLKRNYINKQKLKRMNIKGEVVSEVPFKILKLKSAWHQNSSL